MSDLRDFVLDFCRANGALVDPPRYGVNEVLLPDALAAQLGMPALQEIVFDDVEPDAEDRRLHLAQGHPLIDRMVELARRAPAPAQAHVNAVRLDKRGLAEAARQALSFANARLAGLPKEVERPVLAHYLVLTYKVTLTTDEKQEQLVTVAMDAQAGWPVKWDSIRQQATLEQEAAFGHLEPARPRWIEEPHPLTPAALAGLSERAERAVLAKLSGPIESLSRRAARYLELDRARLEQYYDDLVRDLERRLRRAEGERQATLRDKIVAAQAERRLKLDDAQARYRLRADLELITAQVVTQPKLELLVQIENRNTRIRRRVVWDPLLHCIEPLACNVCGQPGQSLQLCAGGHLAHAECLLQQQCVDCKRVYCRLCADQMKSCAVCGRPVCHASLNGCGICKRGTCHEHVGLCHAADGKPADVRPAEAPAPEKAARPAPAPRPIEAREPAKARPRPKRPAKAPARPAAARRSTANWKLAVEIEWGEPEVRAFVLAGKKRTEAVRCWHLTPRGISVACNCEKADCASNGILLRPGADQAIEAQMRAQIEGLRREYGVPARNVSYTLLIRGAPSSEPRLILRGHWKDEEHLAEARRGFDAEYARQHGLSAPPAKERDRPTSGRPRPLQPHEAAEAERFLKVAFGLLKLEGMLKEEELYARVCDLVHPGEWCSREYVGALLRQNRALFKVLASGLVAIHEVRNVQALAARKRAHHLPQHEWSVEQLLALAGGEQPLTELEERIQAEMRQLGCSEVSVRAVEGGLRQGRVPAQIVDDLRGYYAVSSPQALHRLSELLEELSAHTLRWELGGWTPADAAAVGNPALAG